MAEVGGRSKWLADAKRFNSQQIRRRMKEQKERFNSKNTLSNDGDKQDHEGPQTSFKIETSRPRLTIAVSMSEDPEDETHTGDQLAPTPGSLAAFLTSEASSVNDASAWAMMEHYQTGAVNSQAHSCHQVLNEGDREPNEHGSFWEKALTLESYSLQLSNEASPDSSVDDFAPSTGPIFISTPSNEDRPSVADALVQHSPQEKLQKEKIVQFLTQCPKPAVVLPSPVPKDGDDNFLWQSPEFGTDGRPTPAKLKSHWIKEKEGENFVESPHTSLVQESLILSDGPTVNLSVLETLSSQASTRELAFKENIGTIKSQQAPSDESTSTYGQASKLSTHVLSGKMAKEILLEEDQFDTSGGNNRQLVVRGSKADFTHLEKIHELEESLKKQKVSTNQMQSKLKDRVVELEQALRATAATPRGTIIQENPLKTLLDRNQTLVKEVRFADSTCVELSAKVAALEAEKNILQEQLHTLENENRDLRVDIGVIDSTNVEKNVEVSLTNPKLRDMSEEGMLRQIVKELKAEVSALLNDDNDVVQSSASIILSDMEGLEKASEDDEDLDKSFTSQCLAKALQAQVLMLKREKCISGNFRELQEQLSLEKSRNNELEAKIRMREETESTIFAGEQLSKDLSKLQEENDFLGRQLGKVQEKLDQTRTELELERSRSKTLDRTWRTETTKQLQKIHKLEADLERASRHAFRPHLSLAQDRNSGVLNLGLEKDLSDAKANILSFKSGLESLISNNILAVEVDSFKYQDGQVANLISVALQKMRLNYEKLNSQVDTFVEFNCKRLEKLTETVVFLRASLLFEAESVSTESDPEEQEEKDISSVGSSLLKSLDDDDHLYERMEEARGSPSIFSNDISSDFEDASQLLGDDVTLESILKVAASKVDFEGLKKPLEAAIRECQRVRDRSVALKEELRSEKLAFSQLEMENRRLLLDLTGKEEEKELVERALDEARTRIHDLEERTESLLESKDIVEQDRRRFENRCNSLEAEKEKLVEVLNNFKVEKDKAEDRLSSLQCQADATKEELQRATKSSIEYGKDCESLRSKIIQIESRALEFEEMLMQSRCAQEDMRKERAELKGMLAKSQNETQVTKDTFDKMKTRSGQTLDQTNQKLNSLQLQLEKSNKALQHVLLVGHNIYSILETAGMAVNCQLFEGFCERDVAGFDQIIPLVKAACETASASQKESKQLHLEKLRLTEELQQSDSSLHQCRSQVASENAQNEKLFELLRQAEEEMERSADQIREMSTALSRLQQQESEMISKIRSTERENESVRKELEHERFERHSERSASHHKVEELTVELETHIKSAEMLKSKLESVEFKSSRMKQYVKKLTAKCEEWEKTYEYQGRSLEKLHAKNLRMRERTSEIIGRYKQLASRVKSKNRMQDEGKQRFEDERNDLQKVHEQLERELETITRELSTIEQK